ncbi:MAG TPA: hypothetical protein VMB27_15360 [Solirubrobacteraceae bacterium]|nr:hypothetical protein [Solirubrobacteraceae bacterium]
MLASITPLGERGRRSKWWVTVSAFLIGAAAAGAAAGAALGALGSVALPAHIGIAVLVAAIGVAIVLDGLPVAVPGPRRQVDERWLDQYRGWVYGAGYGAQLGVGVTTIVSSAAMYVAVLAAFLTASPVAGAVVLGCFGVVRGLTPLAAARVRSQRQLLHFHRALGRWRPAARWGVVAAQAGMLVAALALS